MAKLSTSIRTLVAAMVLAIPVFVGCGGGGSGTVPKAENAGPEPQRAGRGVQGGAGGGGATAN